MYAKLIDGQLQYAPEHMRRADGSTVIGYNREPSFMLADGYLPVVHEPQTSEYGGFTPRQDAAQITMVWTPIDAPIVPDPLENYYGVLQSFAALWASLNVGPVPTEWTDALELLANAPVDAQIKLLAYRIALAPVWDAVLERMAAHA
jgi:hypothetical protein